jgi:hypothetical protein
MGVIGRISMYAGTLAVLASVGAAAAGQAGCGSSVGNGARPASTTPPSVSVPPLRVRRPNPPRPYVVPPRALKVFTSAELASALADHRRAAIVLAPGTYDYPRQFSDREGDQIYASRLGGSVLKAGISLGANSGPPGALVRGIKFDVRDRAKTLHGAILHVWGSAAHAAVLDTWLDGHGVIGAGLVVRQPEGFVGRRIVATGFRNYGVAVDPNDVHYRARSPFRLRDVDVSRVARAVPGSSDGTAEACVWLGSAGTVQRVRARGCGVTGIWTGTANRRSWIDDVVVDRTPVGVYIEHFTTGTTFQRLRIGPNVTRGINAEWANPAIGRAASVDNVIQDCFIRTTHVGVYLDQGTTRTLIRRCAFAGQAWAAIGDYAGVDNRYVENDFSQVPASAVRVSYEHDTGWRKP